MWYLSITWQSVEAIGLDCFQERDETKGGEGLYSPSMTTETQKCAISNATKRPYDIDFKIAMLRGTARARFFASS
jgi:hypothetical protein